MKQFQVLFMICWPYAWSSDNTIRQMHLPVKVNARSGVCVCVCVCVRACVRVCVCVLPWIKIQFILVERNKHALENSESTLHLFPEHKWLT